MKTINEKLLAKKAVLEMAEYVISDLSWRFETLENQRESIKQSLAENDGEMDEWNEARKIQNDAQQEFLDALMKWIENKTC